MVPLAPRAAGTHANEAIPRKDHRTRHEVRYKIPAAHERRRAGFALFAMPILMLVTLILFEGSPNEKLILLSWFILGTLISGWISDRSVLFLHADIQYQFKLAQSEPASDAGKVAQLETHEMPEPLLRSGGGARDA